MASGTNSVQTTPGTVKMIRGVGQQGKPITFTLPVGMQGNKTGSPQLISMPQKGLTIGGKAVTVQLAPGNQKTVTIVSSASGGIQKTINAADLQAGGHKIVMMPSKRVANVITTQKAIPMSVAQMTDAGNDQGDNNLMEGTHLEVLEQLDGAFDVDSDNDDEPSRTASGIETDSGTDTESNSNLVACTDRKRIRYQHKKRTNRKMCIASGSGVSKSYQNLLDNRALKKIVPKYVKMGLFGGSPYGADPIEQPESTTEQDTDSSQNEANASLEDHDLGDAHVDTSVTDADGNIVQQSTDDESTADEHKNDAVTTSGEYI